VGGGWRGVHACSPIVMTGLAVVTQYLSPGQEPGPQRLRDLLVLASAVPFAWFGALITTHRPGNRVGGLLLVFALSISGAELAEGYVSYGLSHPGASAVPVTAWMLSWLWVPAVAAFLFLLLVYPDGRVLPGPGWRLVAWAVAGFCLLLVVFSGLSPQVQVEAVPTPLPNPVGLSGPAGALLQRTRPAVAVLLPGFGLLTVAAFLVRF
jgi:hypothetical protein